MQHKQPNILCMNLKTAMTVSAATVGHVTSLVEVWLPVTARSILLELSARKVSLEMFVSFYLTLSPRIHILIYVTYTCANSKNLKKLLHCDLCCGIIKSQPTKLC